MKKSGLAIVAGLLGGVTGAALVGKLSQQVMEDKDKRIDKFKSYYNMLNQWLCIHQQGGSLADYFKKKNYKHIAVYGLGEMGSRLLDELNASEIQVAYGIDKNIDEVFDEIEVFSLDNINEATEQVDAVVVTAIFAYDEIREELEKHFDCVILSLEDVVFE